ncbi:MAG TPA: glycosyltransferase family 9 protein [Thermomicrobiaceae bacterium]|nr:glycosyltransferase family 9 protein [Thermomicrobiaceae bacterium]
MTEWDIVPEVRTIAVLRANGIGDYLFAIPALEALRAAYPSAQITLLGAPWHQAFLTGRPGPVDRVLVVPPCHGVRDTGPDDPHSDAPELQPFFTAMRAEGFDLALQLHGGGGNSNPFVRRLGAPVTAGFRAPGAPPLDRWTPYDYWQREVLRLLEGVALVGARPVALDPRLELLPEDRAEAARLLDHGAGPLVALHPGSGDARRRWPAAGFTAAGKALARRGARVVVTGSADERELAAAVAAGIAGARSLAGALSLGGLAGLFARCDVVVANDTGPLHLARAVGAATVGLYWCGNVVNAGPMTQARQRTLLSWITTCPACGHKEGEGEPCACPVSFVAQIAPEAVIEACLSLLGEGDTAKAQRNLGGERVATQ